ncbi:PTTG1 protein, partial [Polypterus senegalus]|nr:PTTG1 protein [Polypterus senegalus]
MASAVFADKENAELGRTGSAKVNPRLQSAPVSKGIGFGGKTYHSLHSENLKGKQSQLVRKALGAVNKTVSSKPVTATKKDLSGSRPIKKISAPVKQYKDYTGIEKNIPYDPTEFEDYYQLPEDQSIDHLCLARLAVPAYKEADDSLDLDCPMKLSPLKMVKVGVKGSKMFAKACPTPHPGKLNGKPPQLIRKALGAVNKTESSKPVVEQKTSSMSKPKVCAPIANPKTYPEIEKFHPYNPADFEDCYRLPEEQTISHLCLARLAMPVYEEKDDPLNVECPMKLSPVKLLKETSCTDVDSFLQTIAELTDIPLPSLMDY